MISGVTFISSKPEGVPNKTPGGKPINLLSSTELLTKFPMGQLSVFFDNDVQFGCVHLGNDMLAWRLLAPQTTPGQLADIFMMPIRRSMLISGYPISFSTQKLARTSADDIIVPNEMKSAASSLDAIDTKQHFDDRTGSESLSGVDSRNMAFWIMEELSFPSHVLSLIGGCDVSQTGCEDNTDLYDENYLKSYTSANFHPGRVVILGDAAQTLATSAIGSYGLTFAINDACLFTKLLSETFRVSGNNSVGVNISQSDSNEGTLLDQASRKFTKERIDKSLKGIYEARYISSWVKSPPSYLEMVFGKKVWLRSSWKQMQEMGN